MNVLKDCQNCFYLFKVFNVFYDITMNIFTMYVYILRSRGNIFGLESTQKVLNIIYSGK